MKQRIKTQHDIKKKKKKTKNKYTGLLPIYPLPPPVLYNNINILPLYLHIMQIIYIFLT